MPFQPTDIDVNTHLSPVGSPSHFDDRSPSVSTSSSSSSSDSSDEEDDLQVQILQAERKRLEVEEMFKREEEECERLEREHLELEREKREKEECEHLERERLAKEKEEKEKEERRNAKKEEKCLAKNEAKRLAKKEEKLKRSETAANTAATGQIEDGRSNGDTNLGNKRKREQSAQASVVLDSHTKSPPSKRKYILPVPTMGKQLKPLPKNAHKLTIASEDEDEEEDQMPVSRTFPTTTTTQKMNLKASKYDAPRSNVDIPLPGSKPLAEEGEDSDIEVISTTSHRNRSSLSIKKERKISETQLDEKGCYILSLQERDEMQKTIRGIEQ
jgi:hypothetical protein